MAELSVYKYKTNTYGTNQSAVFRVYCDDDSGLSGVRGTEPTDAETLPMTVTVQKNNKEVGIKVRHALLERTINADADSENCLVQTATRYKRVPVLTPDHTVQSGATVTVRGQDYKFIKIVTEELR